MKHSALVFIYDKEKKKFLLVYPITHPEHSPKGEWFTLKIDLKKEKPEEYILHKLNNKFGLDIKRLISLKWGSIYRVKNKEIKEINFLGIVGSQKLKLRKKYKKFEWLELDEFINKINWKDNKKLLEVVLPKAIKNEIYFNKKEREIKS